MKYNFDHINIEKIINKFGVDFFNRVESLIEPLIRKWHIEDLHLIDSFSANLVFKGHSNTFGPIVMKFGRKQDEFNSELTALTNYKSHAVCQLFDVDYDNMVLLEEAIAPGITLQNEKDIHIRLDEFCNLFKQLHQVDKGPGTVNYSNEQAFKYKSYKEWVFDITEYMDQQEAWQEVALHMRRAKDLLIEVSKDYSSESLLHGDFHYYNILKGKNGYKIIDPKGVMGNPIFDLPRYMLNEFWDEEDDLQVDSTIEKVFNVISEKLDVKEEVLSKLLYIEGAMAMCWNIQDGTSIDEKEDMLDTINRLDKYLK